MKVNVMIVDRFMISAAHSAALIEKQYRECKVYGMGTRPVQRPVKVVGW